MEVHKGVWVQVYDCYNQNFFFLNWNILQKHFIINLFALPVKSFYEVSINGPFKPVVVKYM